MSALPAYAAAPIAKPATNGVVCIQSAHQAFFRIEGSKIVWDTAKRHNLTIHTVKQQQISTSAHSSAVKSLRARTRTVANAAG